MRYLNLPPDDLSSVFGPLPHEEAASLRSALGAVEERLRRLATEASELVGVAYTFNGLLVVGGEVSGGPSGDAGDVWIELEREAPDGGVVRWSVWARTIVFCAEELAGDHWGSSCTHDLLNLTSYAFSPAQAISLMAAHVETLARDLRNRSPDEFSGLPHQLLIDTAFVCGTGTMVDD